MRGSSLGLEVYVDADYADKANDRRSVSGIAVTFGGTAVCHASKIQHVVIDLRGRVHCGWGRGQGGSVCACLVLSFIAPETSGATINVFGDNQGAEALIESPLSSARSKHIDVRFCFIHDLFRKQKTSVDYGVSTEKHADILTKALSRVNFHYHRKRLMNLSE